MNGDELNDQQTKSVWTTLNVHGRVPRRWHDRENGLNMTFGRRTIVQNAK
jgi:hypothetical protein